MHILFIGDIVGQPGRRVVAKRLKELVARHAVDVVLANAENAAGGFGITPTIGEELFQLGIDVLTSGNHVWDKKEAEGYLDKEGRLLRPANYPEEAPGRGVTVLQKNGRRVGILNLQGRAFLPAIDCPFRIADREVATLRQAADIIVVDVHAEATAEKQAIGWYLDGRVGDDRTAQLGNRHPAPGCNPEVPDADAEEVHPRRRAGPALRHAPRHRRGRTGTRDPAPANRRGVRTGVHERPDHRWEGDRRGHPRRGASASAGAPSDDREGARSGRRARRG
jgi:hypothetical protein